MRTVLAIDGGTTTGWALAREGVAKPRAGIVQMPDVKNIGRFCNEFGNWLAAFAGLEGVTEVVIEAPIISDHGGSGVNIHEVDKLFGIVHAAEMGADRLDVPSARVARSTVCLHFTGSGKGTRREFKARCIVACQRKGWNVTSEDMADALAVLDWYCHDKREEFQVGWDCKPGGPLFEDNGVRMPTKAEKVASAKLLNKALSFDKGAA